MLWMTKTGAVWPHPRPVADTITGDGPENARRPQGGTGMSTGVDGQERIGIGLGPGIGTRVVDGTGIVREVGTVIGRTGTGRRDGGRQGTRIADGEGPGQGPPIGIQGRDDKVTNERSQSK